MKHPTPLWLKTPLIMMALFWTIAAAQAVQVSFPANTPALRGTQVDIPISISDVTGLNVYSYELQFTFNSSALSVVDVIETGTLSAAWAANEYHEVNGGSLRIVAAGGTPLTGAGILLYVRFDLPIGGSGNSNLIWTTAPCRLNEGSPTLTFVDGFVTITNPPVLSFNPNTATIFASDSIAVSVSGGLSPYTFSVVNPVIAAFHQTSPTAGYFVGLSAGTTAVQATDANLVVGTSGNFIVRPIKVLIPDSTVLSDHTFLMPVNILVQGSGAPAVPVALVAALPTPGPPLYPRLYWQQVAGLSYNVYRAAAVPFVPGGPGVTQILGVADELPADPSLFLYTDTAVDLHLVAPRFYLITAEGAGGSLPLYSGQMRISWYGPYLDLTGIDRTGTLLENWSFQSETHPDYVDVSFSSDQSLAGSGTLFYLQFYVEPGGGLTNLTLSNVLFNEDQFAVLRNGTVTRIAPPNITINPGSAQETVVGDSIQFTVSGGTAPYSWHITNPATGSVTPSGKFYPTAGGLTYIWVQDVNGFTDSSALVTVDDFRLVAQSLSVVRGDSATITLQLVGNATGLGIYSTDLVVSLPSGSFDFAYPITSGTLLNGWLNAYETGTSTIHVAASNGTPLAGSGVFLQLRGRVPAGASTGNRTITINSVNLNEGNRRAFRVNGTLSITL